MRRLLLCLVLVFSAESQNIFFNVSVSGATVATPVIALAGGSYVGAQTTTILESTSGATICYTTNGSDPAAVIAGTCSTGTAYSGTLTISAAGTLKAMATRLGYNNSGVASATYALQAPTPTFSPSPGSVITGTVVTLDAGACSSSIYWSTTNNPPTTSDTHGTSVTVSSIETIYARVIGCPGMTDSGFASGAYILGSLPADTFAGAAGLLSAHSTTTGGYSWGVANSEISLTGTGGIQRSGGSTDSIYLLNFAGMNDYCQQATFTTVDTGHARTAMLVFRFADWSHYILVGVGSNYPWVYAAEIVNTTRIEAIRDTTDTPTNGDVIKACVIGNTAPVITLYVNGTLRGTYTYSGAPSELQWNGSAKPGVWMGGGITAVMSAYSLTQN